MQWLGESPSSPVLDVGLAKSLHLTRNRRRHRLTPASTASAKRLQRDSVGNGGKYGDHWSDRPSLPD